MSLPEGYNSIEFSEPDRTSEKSLGYAAAHRVILERSRYDTALLQAANVNTPLTPIYFKDALADALGDAIELQLQEYNAGAPLSIAASAESISAGDWSALGRELNEVDSIHLPQQKVNNTVATLRIAEMLTLPYTPDAQLANTLILVNRAQQVAKEQDKKPEDFFTNESDYAELIRHAYSATDFAREASGYIEATDSNSILLFVALFNTTYRLSHNDEIYIPDPNDKVIQDSIEEMKSSSSSMKVVESEVKLRHSVADSVLRHALVRYWGIDEAQKVIEQLAVEKTQKDSAQIIIDGTTPQVALMKYLGLGEESNINDQLTDETARRDDSNCKKWLAGIIKRFQAKK